MSKTNFKKREQSSTVFKDVNKGTELPVLISFSEFSHKDSPRDAALHRKMNEALHEICKISWASALNKGKHDLGGLETIPVKQLRKCKLPNHYDKDDVWVMCCGVQVGRLIGYPERTNSGTVFNILRLASAQDCVYEH